jgi:hypothetical protein
MKTSFKTLLLAGLSTVVLTSCLPEDSSVDAVGVESERVESLSTYYAQSFSQYANSSLNALIESPLWKTQTIVEGSIDLNTMAFGNLDLGNAEDMLHSAYCRIGADSEPHLITWFESVSDEGDLEMKGLSDNAAGIVNNKVKTVMSGDLYGIASVDDTGVRIVMKDGNEKVLSGACENLNIPRGSAVAVVKLDAPEEVITAQSRTFTRAENCPVGQSGTITQQISTQVLPDGMITVGGNVYNTEGDLLSSNDPNWSVLSNVCLNDITSNVAVNSVTGDSSNLASLQQQFEQPPEDVPALEEPVPDVCASVEVPVCPANSTISMFEDNNGCATARCTCEVSISQETQDREEECGEGFEGNIFIIEERDVTTNESCSITYGEWTETSRDDSQCVPETLECDPSSDDGTRTTTQECPNDSSKSITITEQCSGTADNFVEIFRDESQCDIVECNPSSDEGTRTTTQECPNDSSKSITITEQCSGTADNFVEISRDESQCDIVECNPSSDDGTRTTTQECPNDSSKSITITEQCSGTADNFVEISRDESQCVSDGQCSPLPDLTCGADERVDDYEDDNGCPAQKCVSCPKEDTPEYKCPFNDAEYFRTRFYDCKKHVWKEWTSNFDKVCLPCEGSDWEGKVVNTRENIKCTYSDETFTARQINVCGRGPVWDYSERDQVCTTQCEGSDWEGKVVNTRENLKCTYGDETFTARQINVCGKGSVWDYSERDQVCTTQCEGSHMDGKIETKVIQCGFPTVGSFITTRTYSCDTQSWSRWTVPPQDLCVCEDPNE